MTSASVKDLSSILTFVGASATNQASNTAGQMNFGDVMTKAEGSGNQNQMAGNSSSEKNSQVNGKDISEKLSQGKRVDLKDESASRTENAKTDKDLQNEGITDEQIDSMKEAASEVIKNISEKMEVSEDEVLEAMEVLAMNFIDVLAPENISNLVLEISDETDAIALATNEELFNNVKNLTSMVDATLEDLAEDMDIEFSDVVSMVEQAEVQLSNTPEMQMSVEANSDIETVKDSPKITVSIEGNNDKDITIETDENGNLIKQQTVTNTKQNVSSEDNGDKEEKSDNKESSSNSQGFLLGSESHVMKELVNDIQEVDQLDTPQQSFFSPETQDIMNQIMDNMKVNLKPDMDELEMQLHPASLGTVKVNIANKAGEITAEFKVQNETVQAAVESQINELTKALKDSGVRIQAVEVSIDTSGFDSNLWKGESKDQNFNQNGNKQKPRRINLNDLSALFEEESTEEEKLAKEMMEANGNTVDYQA